MEHRQQDTELEDIGGELLEDSGFENEEAAFEDELVVTTRPEQQQEEAL